MPKHRCILAAGTNGVTQCSKILRVHQMDIQGHEKKVHIMYAEHSSPNPALPQSNSYYCLNFGTGSSDELPIWALQCPTAFRVYQMGIFDMENFAHLPRRYFISKPIPPSHNLVQKLHKTHNTTQVRYEKLTSFPSLCC